MRVFVTGATGYIGRALVDELLASGHRVGCLVRATSDHSQVAAQADRVIGDLLDPASLRPGLEDADAVVNLAATYEFWVKKKRDYASSNVAGAASFFGACLDSGVPKVVHVSTVAVFGNAPWPIDESSGYGTERANQYAETKLEGELVGWRLHRERGLPLLVVYPAAVIGPDDPKTSGRYIENLAYGRVPAQLFPTVRFPFVDVRDVATGLRLAVEKPDNIGERYLLSGATMTWGEVTRTICEVAGVRPPRLVMPGWLARANAAFLTAVADLTGRPPLWDLSTAQVRLMGTGLEVDAGKSVRELGLAYRPFRTSIEDAVRSIRSRDEAAAQPRPPVVQGSTRRGVRQGHGPRR